MPEREKPFVIEKPGSKSLEELRRIAEERVLRTADEIEVLLFRRGKGLLHLDSNNGLGYARNMYRVGDQPWIIVDEFARKMKDGKRVEIRPISS